MTKLARERNIKKVEELILFGGMGDEEFLELMSKSGKGFSRRTLNTYKKIVYKAFTKLLDNKGELVKQTVMADKTARDDAYKRWKTSGDRRWLLTYLTANEKFADKLLKFGVVDAVKQEFTGEVVFKWKDEGSGDRLHSSQETETVSQE